VGEKKVSSRGMRMKRSRPMRETVTRKEDMRSGSR